MRFPRSLTFLTSRLCKRPRLSLAALLLLVLLATVLVQFAMLPMLRKRAREYALAEIAHAGGLWIAFPNDQSRMRLLLSGATVDDELIEIVSDNVAVLPELVQLDLFQTQPLSRRLSATDWHWSVVVMADCMDVQFSPHGQQAFSVAYDGRMILWDLKTAQAVSEFKLADGRLFCLAVNWEDQRAIVGTETGIIDAHWGTGYTRVYNDQPFVSRVVMSGTHVVTTDGFGGLRIRQSHNLASKSAQVQLYEKEYDHYSDDFLEKRAMVNPRLLVKRR